MRTFQLAPMGDRVIVQIPDTAKTTEGGIIIPETVRADEPSEGVVIAVGPDQKECTVGDKVFYRKHAGIQTFEGEPFLMLETVDFLAILLDKAEPSEAVVDWVGQATKRTAKKYPSLEAALSSLG